MMRKLLKEGTLAPNFVLPANNGQEVSLAKLKGKKVVIFFYPKDNTPGCTIEAKNFRDNMAEFEKANTVIIGISKDSVKSHDNFVEKCGLPFLLGSDLDGKVCKDYGIWTEKSMFGKKYMGIERSTFLIDETGVIRKIWPKVSITGHVEEVLRAALDL